MKTRFEVLYRLAKGGQVVQDFVEVPTTDDPQGDREVALKIAEENKGDRSIYAVHYECTVTEDGEEELECTCQTCAMHD